MTDPALRRLRDGPWAQIADKAEHLIDGRQESCFDTNSLGRSSPARGSENKHQLLFPESGFEKFNDATVAKQVSSREGIPLRRDPTERSQHPTEFEPAMDQANQSSRNRQTSKGTSRTRMQVESILLDVRLEGEDASRGGEAHSIRCEDRLHRSKCTQFIRSEM